MASARAAERCAAGCTGVERRGGTAGRRQSSADGTQKGGHHSVGRGRGGHGLGFGLLLRRPPPRNRAEGSERSGFWCGCCEG